MVKVDSYCMCVAHPTPLHHHTLPSLPRAMSAGHDCATAFKALLELVHQIVLKPTADKKARLPAFSKEVATGVGEVVQVAEVLKG